MNTKTDLMNPATIAALLLLAAATSAAPAMADDRSSFKANDTSPTEIEETSKEQARQANEAAVEEAARTVEADIRLDLDITLIGRTSVLIAGDS